MSAPLLSTPTTNRTLFDIAVGYVTSGISILPIASDGTKSPAWRALPREALAEGGRSKATWKPYQQRLPTIEELDGWYRDPPWGTCYGIGAIGGAVSGGLEIIDLDNMDVVEPWATEVEKRCPGLLDKLVFVETPRPGLHGYYRCNVHAGAQKLARVLVVDRETNALRPKTLIETKGEGGYVLAPGSPPECHPSGRTYTAVPPKELTDIQTISEAERDVLLEAARSLDKLEPPAPQPARQNPRTQARTATRPGDRFDESATWHEILTPHGWVCTGVDHDGAEHWLRPGKEAGRSATANFGGSGLLHVFSSNADPFEGDGTYSKFAAYALLNFGGDYAAAAAALQCCEQNALILPRQRRRRSV